MNFDSDFLNLWLVLEQQDYLKRQIDQLARVLGKLLSDLLSLNTTGQISERIEVVDQTLKKELDFDIDGLLQIPANKFIDTLRRKKFSNSHFDSLAHIFFLMAEHAVLTGDKGERVIALYEKCLMIYKYLNDADATYSLDRYFRIEKIKMILK